MTLDEEGLLTAEFDRVFSKESPEAIEWAFRAWRVQSPYFPSIADLQKLIRSYRRAERERQELEAQMSEKLLLEERRKQGQVPDFVDVVKQLREIVNNANPEWAKRENAYRDRMQHAMSAVPTLTLTEEQIQARRAKERAEIDRYRDIDRYREEQGFS